MKTADYGDLLTVGGRLFVFAGPSGAGKSTICQALLDRVPGIVFSVSYTTRPPRPAERDGRDYYFVSKGEFEGIAKADGFLEFATVHGHQYGTARSEVRRAFEGRKDLLLDIDVQGAAKIRRQNLAAVMTFVAPPSLAALRERLVTRGQNDPQEIEIRLRRAEEEIKAIGTFDYLVINDKVEEAIEAARCIICAERRRIRDEKKDRG